MLVYSNGGESVAFGGQRAVGEDWFGLSDENPLLHVETWDVAANPLTGTLWHANIQTDAIVKEDGTIVMTHYVSDKLDLKPGEGHTPAYNKVTSVLGPVYHDILSGNDIVRYGLLSILLLQRKLHFLIMIDMPTSKHPWHYRYYFRNTK